jgi:soluble lytic murein transglycosylase-like protein
MRISPTRSVLGMGLSGAVWAAVALHPTALARERLPAVEPEEIGVPADGPLADSYRAVAAQLAEAAPAMAPEARAKLAAVIAEEADAARLDPLLVLAVIEVESGFRPEAISGAGAKGLMQLLEPTLMSELARSGIPGDPADPLVQVRAGVRFLRRLLDAFHREEVALMAYYAGPARILGYLRAGEIPERFHVYPRRVKAVQRRLQRVPAPRAAVAVAERRAAGEAQWVAD